MKHESAIIETKVGRLCVETEDDAIVGIGWRYEQQSDFSTLSMQMLNTLLFVHKAVEHGDWSRLQVKEEGTDFQRAVWAAIRQVPKGKRVTYTELAASLGCPKAARAVATAVGRNRLALYTPCHRVVRADGSIGKFRWDTLVKEKLLILEGANLPPGSE